MKMRLIISCILSTLLFASCEKQQSGPPGETATTGSFQLVADEVLKPVVDSLVQGYMIENPTAKVTVKYTSAAEAVRELMNHDARAILIDRALTPAERTLLQKDSVTLPEYILAEDGIGCIVSAKNKIDALRISAIRRILNGVEKDWSGIEMTYDAYREAKFQRSQPITLVLPQYPSSIEYVLDSMFLGADKQITGVHLLRFSTTDSIISYVRSDPNAIGFIGSSWNHWLNEHSDTSVKVLPVIPSDSSSRGLTEPILLHIAYIYKGLYPLVTPVNGYSFEPPNTVPRGFLAYAANANGQRVFKDHDVLPKTQIIHIVQGK
jgi:ABC-type phosphate transport system substrate-binding protein